MEKISLGIIGCGEHALNSLVPAIARIGNCDLCSATTTSASRAQVIHKFFSQTRITSDIQSVIADPHLDAILIASPNSTHAQYSQSALSHGKHVLCEKPGFLTEREATETLGVARAQSRLFREAFMYRFHPQHELARSLIAEHCRILRHLEIKFTYPLKDQANIRLSKAAGGGAMNDVGCYAIDAIQFFLQSNSSYAKLETTESSWLSARLTAGCYKSANDALNDAVDLRSWFSGPLGNGVSVQALAAMDLPRQNRISFFGTNGAVHLLSAFRAPSSRSPLIVVEDNQGKQKTIHAPASDQVQTMVATFVEEVRRSKASLPLLPDYRWSDPLNNAVNLELLRDVLSKSQ